MAKFLRRLAHRESKLGKNRKKKQIWRRATGRHNKMREKRRGYPQIVGVGHKKEKKIRNKIQGKRITKIENMGEMEKVNPGQIIIIGNVGRKKKVEIIKKAKEKKIEIYGINPDKFINKHLEKDSKSKGKKNEPKKEKTAS
ncbi:MAG: eL32 family ribosomal protein [Nanoarchaeota archaeon]